jgi:hypothetical protein
VTHNWLRFLVPREWTPEQALLVVQFLRQARDAVWEVHGEKMAAVLGQERQYADRLAEYIDLDPNEPSGPDDDIPF